MTRIPFLLLFLLALVSCNQAEDSSRAFHKDVFQVTEGGDYSVASMEADEPNFMADQVSPELTAVKTGDLNGTPNASKASSIPRKLIRNGSMHCKVGSIDSARTQLLAILEGYQGYVSSESAHSNYQSEMNYTLRVPEAKFDNFIIAVEGISTEVFSRNINVNDVTDQYVDIAARLSTKRALHKRYTQLLSRAKNVEEVINVERELSKVLADIESSEARLKSLGDRASYATLQLSFSTEVEPIAQAGFFSELGGSFANGWSGVKMAIILGATLWPLLIIGLLLTFGIRWIVNRRKVLKA